MSALEGITLSWCSWCKREKSPNIQVLHLIDILVKWPHEENVRRINILHAISLGNNCQGKATANQRVDCTGTICWIRLYLWRTQLSISGTYRVSLSICHPNDLESIWEGSPWEEDACVTVSSWNFWSCFFHVSSRTLLVHLSRLPFIKTSDKLKWRNSAISQHLAYEVYNHRNAKNQLNMCSCRNSSYSEIWTHIFGLQRIWCPPIGRGSCDWHV